MLIQAIFSLQIPIIYPWISNLVSTYDTAWLQLTSNNLIQFRLMSITFLWHGYNFIFKCLPLYGSQSHFFGVYAIAISPQTYAIALIRTEREIERQLIGPIVYIFHFLGLFVSIIFIFHMVKIIIIMVRAHTLTLTHNMCKNNSYYGCWANQHLLYIMKHHIYYCE